MTLNAREVDLVQGLVTRNAHVHLSRFSSISGTDFVGLLDDAIESILEPTETLTARNTGTTTTTNDTPSVSVTGATSSLSASLSGAAIQSVLLEQHGAPEYFRTTAATVAGSTAACHGCGRGWQRNWPAV